MACLRIDLVEPDGGPVVLRIPQSDWAGDERKPQVATPDWTRGHLHGLVAREVSSPYPLCRARFLGFSFVIFERIFDPREIIADQFLDLIERIPDVATIVPALCEMSLMSSDLQRLPKPIEAFAGQKVSETRT